MIRVHLDQKAGLLVMEGDGVVSNADVEESIRVLRDLSSAEPARGILLDLRGVSQVTVSTEGIKRTAEDALAAADQLANLKLATVAPTDVTFGLARMYGFYRDAPGTTRVFRELGAALEWLGPIDGDFE